MSIISSHPNIRRLSSTVKYICWKFFYFMCIFVKNLNSLKVLYFINPSHKCMLTTANKTGFAYVCSLHILWMKISYPVYLKLVQFLLILFLISCLVFKTSLARCFRNYFHIHKSFSQKKKHMHSSFWKISADSDGNFRRNLGWLCLYVVHNSKIILNVRVKSDSVEIISDFVPKYIWCEPDK